MMPKDIFTLESLITWLETKPRDEVYEFSDGENCMFAQYLKHHGHSDVYVGGYGHWSSAQGRGCWPTQNQIALIGISRRTFGAALDVARWEQRRTLP